MLIYAAYLLIWALTVSPISTVLIYHFRMDCHICAATVMDESGDFVLHYVYSSDSSWKVQLFNKVRDSFAEPYKSLIPILEKDDDEKKDFFS